MEHSKTFGFSGAGIWGRCSGSVLLAVDEPELPDTPDSLEGDAAHWVGEQMLKKFKEQTPDVYQYGESLIGQSDPKGTIITEDMFDAAWVYVEDITKVVGDDVDNLHVELRVHSGHIDPEAWGTSDAFYYDASTNTLHVWDFKYGHSSVLAEDNFQLVGYAFSFCEMNQLIQSNPRLSLNIVQPRCFDGNGAVRNWVTSIDQVRAHINIMKGSVAQYRGNNSRFVTGDHCRHCQSSYRCAAITKVATMCIDISMEGMVSNPTNESLAYQKQLIDTSIERLKSKQQSIDIQLTERIKRGEPVQGYRMDTTYSNRNWTCDADTAFMIGDVMKVDLRTKTKPITPTQAMAAFKKKGIDESVILNYSAKSKTGLKLTADDGSEARRIFSKGKL